MLQIEQRIRIEQPIEEVFAFVAYWRTPRFDPVMLEMKKLPRAHRSGNHQPGNYESDGMTDRIDL